MVPIVLKRTNKTGNRIPCRIFVSGIILLVFRCISYGQEGFQGLIVEKVPVTAAAISNDPKLQANSFAYRIFADLDTNYVMQAVFGGGTTNELIFTTTTGFYNNTEFGGTTGKEIFTSLLNDNPALAFDSYITVNTATNNRLGILHAEDTTDAIADGFTTGSSLPLQVIGADFGLPFGTEDFEGKFSSYNCAYNVNGGERGPTISNRVLIGQFTTDGVFSFEINIQIRRTDGQDVQQFVARDPQAGAYQHPALHYPGLLIQITSPADSYRVNIGDSVHIAAASGSGDLAYVEFFVNGDSIDTDFEAPYQASWIAVEGRYFITAVGKDNLGASDTSAVVEVIVGSLVSPTVDLSSPAASASFTLGAIVYIAAEASDQDGSISLVEFYANDIKIGEDNTAPYELSWTSDIAGAVNLKAIATDDDGLQALSPIVGITIDEETGLIDPDSEQSISIFPNPSKAKITIGFSKMSVRSNYQSDVIDLHGKSHLKRQIDLSDGMGSVIFDISSLPKGVYFIRLVSDDDKPAIYKKIIKE
jgi:hypothetical protein